MRNAVVSKKNCTECRLETTVHRGKRRLFFPGVSADGGEDNFILFRRFLISTRHSVSSLLTVEHEVGVREVVSHHLKAGISQHFHPK